jgi:hypothetical protein
VIRAFNLAALVRHQLDRSLTREDDGDHITLSRDDAVTSADVATLTAWLTERLGWRGCARGGRQAWRAHAARHVPLTWVFSDDERQRKQKLRRGDNVVMMLGDADNRTQNWLGGCVGKGKVWMEHEWDPNESKAEQENGAE